MKPVTVSKSELLDILTRNRDSHREVFLTAQRRYREELIRLLDERLAEVRAGRKIDHYLRLPEPEDHTGDYDRAIRMIEMSVQDVIEIDEKTFGELVLDEWSWSERWAQTTSSYTSV